MFCKFNITICMRNLEIPNNYTELKITKSPKIRPIILIIPIKQKILLIRNSN